MFLILASVLFATYTLNVSLVAFDGAPFVGDVGEMLLLLAASVAFVAGILRREAAEKQRNQNSE